MKFNSKTKSKTINKNDIDKVEEKKKEYEVVKNPSEVSSNTLMAENLGYNFEIPFYLK